MEGAKKKTPTYRRLLGLDGPDGEPVGVTIAYIRVSTEDQVEKYGLSTQKADIEVYCAQKKLDVAEWFTEKGVSGGMTERPALDAMREYIKTHRVARILIYDLSRLARDHVLAETLWREFTNLGTDLVSVTEHFTNDSEGALFRGIKQVFNAYDKAKMKTRMLGGKIRAIKDDGRWVGGWGCFGYRSVGNGQIIIIEAEAETIRLIFELMVQCLSDVGIAKEINRCGIKTMTGLAWDHHSVSQVTRKFTFYAAQSTNWYDVESANIAHEPILSPDLIARVEDHLRPHPDLITTAQAAKLAGVCRLTIERWRAKGILEAKVVKRKNLRVGGNGGNGGTTARYYFDPEQVKAVKPQQGVKLDKMPMPPRTPKIRLVGSDMTSTPPGQLTVLQAAERLGCSAPTIRMMIEHGELDLAGTYTLPNGIKGWLLDEAQMNALLPRPATTRRLSGEAHPAALKPYIPPLPAHTQAKLDAQMAGG